MTVITGDQPSSRFVAFALSGVLMIFSGASYTFALFSPALKARLGGGQATVQAVALAHGLWDGAGPLDFTRAYSRGEYANKYYSGRRVWDGYRRLVPSLALPAEYGDLRLDAPANAWGRSVYPFSARVRRSL